MCVAFNGYFMSLSLIGSSRLPFVSCPCRLLRLTKAGARYLLVSLLLQLLLLLTSFWAINFADFCMVKSACLPATPCALLVEMLPFLDKEEKQQQQQQPAAQQLNRFSRSFSLTHSLPCCPLFVNASVNLGDIFTFAFRPCLRSLWRSLSQFLLLFVYFLIIIALWYNCPWPHTHTQRERHTDTFTQRVDKLRAQQRAEKLQTNRTLSMDMCVCVCVYVCVCVGCVSSLAPAWPQRVPGWAI